MGEPPRGTSPVEEWDALFGEFYFRGYGGRQPEDAAEREALAAARLAGCEPGADVLDVPCGYGRHSLPLARAGYRVVGLDRSEFLLEEARRRAGGAEWPRLVRGDYREIPFPDASFDVAFNLFSSLGYLGDAEDLRVLREIARVLRPGGRLVVEILSRDRLARIFQPRSWDPLPEGWLLLEEREFDVAAGVIEGTQTLVPPDAPRTSHSFRLRVYTPTELVAMVRQAGFDEIACYGDLEGAPLTLDTRLAVVATRAQAPAP